MIRYAMLEFEDDGTPPKVEGHGWRGARTEAVSFACRGGQGLHLHREYEPAMGRQAWEEVTYGNPLGDLYDQDLGRLIETAAKCGRLNPEHAVLERGTIRQRIELCAGPLKVARVIAAAWAAGRDSAATERSIFGGPGPRKRTGRDPNRQGSRDRRRRKSA